MQICENSPKTAKNATTGQGMPRVRSAKTGFAAPAALAALAMFAALGCGGDPEPRTYSEVAFKELPQPAAGSGGMGALPPTNASPVDLKVTWELPQDWLFRDSANAMRIGSFAVPDSRFAHMGEADPGALDVSVVQLAGDAGGVPANIARWMGQVGLIANAEEIRAFIAAAPRLKAKTGQEGIFVDFTDRLSGDMTQDKSIYGAIISTPDYTVFVKAMGERERLQRAKAAIKGFCESLSIRGPEA